MMLGNVLFCFCASHHSLSHIAKQTLGEGDGGRTKPARGAEGSDVGEGVVFEEVS